VTGHQGRSKSSLTYWCPLSSLLRQLRSVSYSVSCWINIFLLANYIILTSLT